VAAQPASHAAEPESGTLAFPITPEQAGVLHEVGATICVTEIQNHVPRLAAFVAAIKRQLGYPGMVVFNAYASAPGTGFNWHFDARIACTLQIEGTKRWRFSRGPALPWPRSNGVRRTDGSPCYAEPGARADWERLEPLDPNEIQSVTLQPGDLLVLPAGVWHDACGGSTGSLALNLAFLPFSYNRVVEALLDGLLTSDPSWRSAPPVLASLAGLPGEVDAAAVEAVRKQLERAADALRSLAADGAEIARAWGSFVQSASPLGALPTPSPTVPIALDDRLRVRADGDVYVRTLEGGTKLAIFIGRLPGMEVEGITMRIAQRAIAAREFVAGDCLAWSSEPAPLAWGDVDAVLRGLIAAGILERVAP
jgi:ribosomal protein L16 Arg81 hydroxylase